jgi:type I restriction enzyme S subunit
VTWQKAKLKYVTRLIYGDPPPRIDDTQQDSVQEGSVKVFGSKGTFATCNQANTKAPAIIVGRKGSYGKINWSQESCFASDTTLFIDETTTKQHLRWLFYLLQTLNPDQGTEEAAVPGLNRDDAYDREVLVPSLSEQRAIANYLDHETAKIDKLISAKKRLLDLLTEKRQSLITHVITCGLNTSNVTYISEDNFAQLETPLQKVKLKYVTRLIYGDPLPRIDNTQEDSVQEGSVKVFGSKGTFATCNQANTKAPAIIVGRKGSYGKINWSQKSCFASDTTFFMDETTTKQHLRWLFYLLQTLNLDQGTEEAAVPGLNRDDVYDREVLVPSLSEQRAIANYLDHETAKIDRLIIVAKNTIKLLQEQRTALITAAVTGQIKVTA